jgi:hypothetical protein
MKMEEDLHGVLDEQGEIEGTTEKDGIRLDRIAGLDYITRSIINVPIHSIHHNEEFSETAKWNPLTTGNWSPLTILQTDS